MTSPSLSEDQLDAVLAALADPVPFTAGDLAALRRRVLTGVAPAASAPPAAPTPLVVRPGAARPRRLGLAVLVAAAVLALVATLTVGVVHAARPGGSGPAGTRPQVSCLADPDRPTPAATARARSLLSARLAALAAAGTAVTSTAVTLDGDGRVLVSAEGVDRDELAALCTSPRPALRPLLSAPVKLGAGDTACALPEPGPPGGGDVLCDSVEDPTLAYRLAPAIVGPAGFADAAASPPVDGATDWTVEVSFAPAAQAVVADYTTAHNAGGRPASSAPCGPAASPCALYLGVVVGGAVQRAPGIQSAITGSLQVSGRLDRTSATLLAAELGAGDLTLVAS